MIKNRKFSDIKVCDINKGRAGDKRGIKQMFRLLFCLVCMLMLFVGCNNSTIGTDTNDMGDNATDGRLSIIAVNFPAYDCARAVAGEAADVSMLLKPGAEAHSFEPTAQNMVAISGCDIFIYGGGESDVWVDGLLDAVDNPDMVQIRMMDCTNVLTEQIKEGMTADIEHDDADNNTDDGEYDEHVWTDPLNMIKIAEATGAAMMQADPDNAGVYAANLAEYTTALTKLDADIRAIVAKSGHKTLIFGDRFPFRYFVEEYGLDYWAAFPGCSGQTEPSAATLAFLIDKMRELQLPVVLKVELSNDNIARIIADEVGAEVRTLYACHNVSLDDFQSGETYITLMQRNLAVLEEALL